MLFATKVTGVGEETKLELVGKPFKGLQKALFDDDRLKSFKLEEAAGKKPEEPDGLNIESLCADGESLLIGFRNPVPEGKALLVPLKNPAAVTDSGASPMLGDPDRLDLRGLGIRDMARWREEFIIVAGDFRGPQSGGSATIEAVPVEWQKCGSAGAAGWGPRGFESGGSGSLWRGSGGKTTAFER